MRVGGSVQQWVVESEETVPLMEPEGGGVRASIDGA